MQDWKMLFLKGFSSLSSPTLYPKRVLRNEFLQGIPCQLLWEYILAFDNVCVVVHIGKLMHGKIGMLDQI